MACESATPPYPYPYHGLRRFDSSDSDRYQGRDYDLKLCLSRLRNPAVRVLVVQGMSGSGKSSFIRAGLIPRIEREAAERDGSSGVIAIGGVVNAGASMMQSLAKQIYVFVMEGPGRQIWREEMPRLTQRFAVLDEFVANVATDVVALIEFLDELSANSEHAALIAIDQVEEYFTGTGAGDPVSRKNFLHLVGEFARERFNAKLVLSVRTEQYGVFASGLPQSSQPAFVDLRSVNRLFHHYLADPSREQLLQLVQAPASAYEFYFEPGAAEYIVDKLCEAATAPEMCVLPLIQTVLLHLYLDARERAIVQGGGVVILKSAFQTLHDRADGKSTGFISDFVDWGLAEAVHAVLRTEPGSQEQRMEVSCWHEVLRAMSSRSAIGVRIRDRMTPDDIGRLALKENCSAGAAAMAGALSGPRIGLLSPPDADGYLALQHDLICLSFDLAPAIASPPFWVQAARSRRQRIRQAVGYGIKDLFDVHDNPPPQKLRVSELRFWDHKSLAYAEHLGLFARLGLHAELVPVERDVSASELRRELQQAPGAHAVFSYPRVLMNAAELDESRDIVILNSFTGYAVVCNRRAAEVLPIYDEKENWGSFERVCTALMQLHANGCRFEPEDDGACEFLVHMLDIHRNCTGSEVVRAAVGRIRATTHSSDLAGLEFVNALLRVESEPWVAIVTTPTWALAMVDERSMLTVIEQRALLGLLDSGRADEPVMIALRRKLEVRNVMNLTLGDLPPGQDAETLMMRLVSVGLFVANCMWAEDREAGKWIHKRWSDQATLASGQQVSMPVFMGTFRRSCAYVTAEEHGRRYFGTTWDDDCPTALWLHHRWQQARMDYERQLAALTTLQGWHGAEPDDAICRLVRRARKHAEIENYHDAQRLMAESLQLFGRTGDGVQPPLASEAP